MRVSSSFLSGGLIKGIGEVLAHRIVQEFHKDTFNIIENHPEELAKIKGISRPAAERIQQQFKEVSSIRGVVIELQKLGLTIREAMLAYEAYGQSAPYLIEKNPYRLMDDIRGIGFEKADRIAAGMGMENYGGGGYRRGRNRLQQSVRYQYFLRGSQRGGILPCPVRNETSHQYRRDRSPKSQKRRFP